MKLSEKLTEDSILINSPLKTKQELIEQLVDLVVASGNLNHRDEILQAVVSREEKMSTGIGCGLAVPHCKVTHVEDMHLAAVTCEDGVDFSAIDKEPVYLLILIVSPENTVGPHIRALSSVSRIMADAEVRQRLIDSQNSQEFLEILQDAESKYS